jgi:hypothetical protein
MSTTTTPDADLAKKVDDLNRLILEGKIMEAFETYYADDLIMQEGAEEPIVGKDANREREEAFVGGLEELRAAELKAVAVGADVTMCEWHFDYTHSEWGDATYDQVAVQRWENGKIVHERFYKAS